MAAGPGGRLFAAWRKIFGTGGASEVRDIVVASSADHGATWSPPVRVHADDWHVNYCPDAGPSIKVGGDGVVHAAWWTGKPGAAGVRYAQSRDGGHTFGTPVALGVASASRAAHAQLALADAHRVVVVWDDGTRAIPPVVVRVSEDDGLTFNRGDTLTAPGESAGYPVLAIAHDTVVVAWQQRTLAGVAADSLREQERAAAMHGAASTAPSAARWINRVGSWSVVMRAAALR